ncbi:hypothetical protein Anapl_02809 [Anas platyrhynchos]|uniref:Uncharacterized protein n=1 Tax=Anas platyrhynchos TaxID=8839 RepID=R0K4H2_ANAPL|nr:hypothetical protein Anapl_02809 [Anas platyrhynchos]
MVCFTSESEAALNSDHNRESAARKQMESAVPDMSITNSKHFIEFSLTQAHSNGYIPASSPKDGLLLPHRQADSLVPVTARIKPTAVIPRGNNRSGTFRRSS